LGGVFPIVQVDGELWDLDRPLEGHCSLQLLKFEDDEGWLASCWVELFLH